MSQLAGADLPIDGRLRLFAALLGAAFAIFELRLFQLQIVDADELREQALAQLGAHRAARCAARRDRGPRGARARQDALRLRARRRAERSPAPRRHLRRARAAARSVSRRSSWRRSAIRAGSRASAPCASSGISTRSQLARVETHRFALPGVSTRVRPLRHYLDGPMAAHLLGTLGEIRGDQLEQEAVRRLSLRRHHRADRARVDPRVPAARAHGRPQRDGRRGGPRGAGARRDRARDGVARRARRSTSICSAPRGRRSTTSRRASRRRWARRSPSTSATATCCVMLSQPDLRPERCSPAASTPRRWKALTGDEWDPLRNRAIQNHYPPGSTHKAVVAAALLQEGVINAHSRAFCPGFFRFGGRTLPLLEAGGPRLGRPGEGDPAILRRVLLHLRRTARHRQAREHREVLRARSADRHRPLGRGERH